MAIPMFARGGTNVETATRTDPRDADLRKAAEDIAGLVAELDETQMELAATKGRAERAEAAAAKARTALLDTAADVAAMDGRLLPLLPPGLFADDPMPEDGVSWKPVEGDAYELPALAGVDI